MYCGKCGSEIDKKTGLCPSCDAAALEKVQEVNTKTSLKRAKRRGVTAIIALILVIAIVVSSVIFAISKGWIGNNSEEERKKVQTTFITYLNKTILPEIGEYDSDHPESSSEGVHSALFCDLNNDGTDEFVVAYRQKNGSQIDFRISCYEYEENTVAKETTRNDNNENTQDEVADDVELVGNVTPYSETDYAENDDEMRLPNETVLYSVEYDGKIYIICEHISYLDDYSYECHVFSMENGKFVEVSNLYRPSMGTDGTELVYSTDLPDEIEIDNSDFDFYAADSGDYIKNDYCDNGGMILYFQEGENAAFVYDTYYSAANEAISDFFHCYGIEKGSYILNNSGSGRTYQINYPDDSNLIFSYVYYFEYDEDDNMIEKYEINDYTDFKSLIGSDGVDGEDETDGSGSTTPAQPEEPDVKAIIEEAAAFSNNIASPDLDYEKTMQIEADGYSQNLYYFKSDTVKTWEDFCSSCSYYTPEMVSEHFAYIAHADGEDGLYMRDGEVDSAVVFSYVVYEKKSDTQYKIKVHEFYDCNFLLEPEETELTLSYTSGRWIFSDVLDWSIYGAYASVDAESDDYEKFLRVCEYNDVLTEAAKTAQNADMSYDVTHALYDVDSDGVDELIVHTGESEQVRKYNFYSYKSDKLISLGSVSAFHAGLYSGASSGALARVANFQGSCDFASYSVSDNKIVETALNMTEAEFNGEYSSSVDLHDSYYDSDFFETLMK